MTLKECYEAMGASYDEVISRLRSERMVQKFVLKFLDDGSYKLLLDSMASEDYAEAFRASHSIKGVCQNLAFTKLMKSSSALTEALRSGLSPEAPSLLEEVKADYGATVSAIRTLKASL